MLCSPNQLHTKVVRVFGQAGQEFPESCPVLHLEMCHPQVLLLWKNGPESKGGRQARCRQGYTCPYIHRGSKSIEAGSRPPLGLGCYPARWHPDIFQIYLADKDSPPNMLSRGHKELQAPQAAWRACLTHRGIEIPRGQSTTVELELMDNFSFHKLCLIHSSRLLLIKNAQCKTAFFFLLS